MCQIIDLKTRGRQGRATWHDAQRESWRTLVRLLVRRIMATNDRRNCGNRWAKSAAIQSLSNNTSLTFYVVTLML